MSAFQQQQQSANKWNNSIFIPMIDFSVTKNQIKQIMEEYFGKVSRIDFVSFNSDNGCGRRAFIHFASWYKNDYAKCVRYNIETNGHYDMLLPVYGATSINGMAAKYTVRLLINKNPVPETEQTIQQVASNPLPCSHHSPHTTLPMEHHPALLFVYLLVLNLLAV